MLIIFRLALLVSSQLTAAFLRLCQHLDDSSPLFWKQHRLGRSQLWLSSHLHMRCETIGPDLPARWRWPTSLAEPWRDKTNTVETITCFCSFHPFSGGHRKVQKHKFFILKIHAFCFSLKSWDYFAWSSEQVLELSLLANLPILSFIHHCVFTV